MKPLTSHSQNGIYNVCRTYTRQLRCVIYAVCEDLERKLSPSPGYSLTCPHPVDKNKTIVSTIHMYVNFCTGQYDVVKILLSTFNLVSQIWHEYSLVYSYPILPMCNTMVSVKDRMFHQGIRTILPS